MNAEMRHFDSIRDEVKRAECTMADTDLLEHYPNQEQQEKGRPGKHETQQMVEIGTKRGKSQGK